MLEYSVLKVEKEVSLLKERWSKMTTLTIQNSVSVCDKGHTPHVEAISTDNSNFIMVQYTFCEVCEQNIDRFYIDDDYDRLPFWSKWGVTK